MNSAFFGRAFEVLWEARLAVAFATGLALVASAALRQQRWSVAAASAAAAVLALAYLPGLLEYLSGLSADAFAEVRGFDAAEASFYAASVLNLLEATSGRRFALMLATTLAASALALVALRRWPGQQARLGAALAAIAIIAIAVHLGREIASANALLRGVRANLATPVPTLVGEVRPLHVVVLIGESASVMDWQLYGYQRATNPRLTARAAGDPGLLVQRTMLATQAHTTPSLIEALGIPAGPPADPPLPTLERRFHPLVGALAAHGIDTVLITNQGQTGTWNVGATAAFAAAVRTVRSAPTGALGNNDWLAPRPFDHAFFAAELPRAWRAAGPQALFLHAYAGHGPYLDSIPPEARAPVDGLLAGMRAPAVVGDSLARPAAAVADLEAYDSAMRYTDQVVDEVIGWLADRDEPAVLLYFSDHGESPWTGAGHDAARFAHEMLRVPALLYFNDAAQRAMPERFAAYQAAAAAGAPRSLAVIPATVLDLFGLRSDRPLAGLAEPAPLGPLLVRRVDGELRWLAPDRPHDGDHASAVFWRARAAGPRAAGAPALCYHRADNLARLRRALLVADCVELDVGVPEGGGRVEVFHPPVPSAGLALATALDAIAPTAAGLWLDAASIGAGGGCAQLAATLERWDARHRALLVELPPDVDLTAARMASCAARFAALGARVSYYVPTELARECAAVQGRPTAPACAALAARLAAVASSGWFSDLSFDHGGLAAVRAAPAAAGLRWNTWGIDVASYAPERFAGYGFVIVDSDRDPNRY